MGKREEEGAGEAGLRAHRATRLGQGVGVGGPQVNSAETLQHLDDCLGKRLHQDGRPFCMKSGPTVTRSQGGTAGQVGSWASLGLGRASTPLGRCSPTTLTQLLWGCVEQHM